MKRVLLSIAVLLSSLTAFAQMEIIPMDWAVIKEIVAEAPEEVRDLAQRLAAPELDTTLTFNDRVIAFYGQSILSDGKESSLVSQVSRLYSQEDYAGALGKAQEALDINPLNIRVLDLAANSAYMLCQAGDTTHTMDEAKLFFHREMRLLNTIAITGVGSEELPFCVTSVADEYDFMQTYLELYEYESQALVGNCDVFTLKTGSKYYEEKTIWFDASRPLELLAKELGQ